MRRAVAYVVSVLGIASLVGCAAPPPLPHLDLDAVGSYLGTGTGGLTGQAFLTTRGGDVKYAAGSTIYLFPDVPLFREWVQRSVNYGIHYSTFAPPASNYIRTTAADGSGNFSFSDLPAGNYLAYTELFWDIGDGTHTGRPMALSVTISDGGVARVILN